MPQEIRNEEKEARILKEKRRLKKIFKDLDENKLKTAEKLIDSAAFMAITLQDLEAIINRNGCTAEYQNGENQRGVKKSAEVDIHLSMTKNFALVMRQLQELAPPAPKKNSRLKLFVDS